MISSVLIEAYLPLDAVTGSVQFCAFFVFMACEGLSDTGGRLRFDLGLRNYDQLGIWQVHGPACASLADHSQGLQMQHPEFGHILSDAHTLTHPQFFAGYQNSLYCRWII